MRIATTSLNYYGQNSVAKCRAAGTKIRKQKVDFAGLTEVRSAPMREGLVAGLHPSHTLIARQFESPLAYMTSQWDLIDTFHKLGTHGKHQITPTLYVEVGVFKNKKTGKIIDVAVTHLVPLTIHGHKRPNFAERMNMWRKHWAILKGIVHDSIAMGHTIFVIGDFNNSHAGKNIIKQLHPKAKWVIRKGLDWVFVVEGTTRVTRFGITRKFRTGSDHAAYWRQLILR